MVAASSPSTRATVAAGKTNCHADIPAARATTSSFRRVRRWEHEAVIDRVQARLIKKPKAMTVRKRTIEHVFGTLKHWMGSTHFLTRTLANVGTEMSLHVLAYNLKRLIGILGMSKTMKAIKLMGT